VKFSHHAKNQLRLYGGTGEEVETIVQIQSGKGLDHRGNRCTVDLSMGD
jgi:hypothetical protein